MVEEQKQVVSSRAKSRRERVEHARSRDILDVAHELNMELFRSGRDYRWKEHDSMVISPEKNMWNWFSKNKGGDVITLVQTMKEIDFNQAIDYLNDGRFKDFTIEERVQESFNYYLKPYEQPFEAARNYLKEQRGLSDETIDFFLEKGLLAQANAKINGSIEPVVVFKAFNFSGELVGATLQGIEENWEKWPERGYAKNIVRNSDGSTGMHVDIGQPKRLVFAESAIDLMSYYELHKEQLSDVRLVSMDGLKEAVVGHHLAQLQSDLSGRPLRWTNEQLAKGLETAIANDFFADGKHADWITLAVDNDTGGQQFVRSLREKGALLTADLPDLQAGQEKSDWNDILRNSSVDNSRLARSKRKLERLNQEFAEATEAVYSHSARANGQPMNDKRGGAAYFKRQNQLEEKVFTKLDEIKKQEERVERLQWQQELKEQGLNRQGTGLEMSVQNIPRIREELEKAERGESFYTKATLKRYRQELTRLEGIAEQLSNTSIQPGAQALVDEGRLNQWAKQPNIYFVKGLRKVALELGEDGLFVESAKYRPRTDQEKEEVANLLVQQSEVVPEIQTESLQEEVDAYITSITQDDSAYYLWQDEELLDLGADGAILEDFHSLLEDQRYQVDGVPLYVEDSINDGATGYLSLDGSVLDGDGIRDYLTEQGFSEQKSVEFLTKLEDQLPEIWEDVLEHYNQAAEKIIEKYNLEEQQQEPSVSQVKTYDEVKQENEQLAKRIEERIKAGELTISFDTDVYLYDVFAKLGNSHPTKYINDKRLEILTPLRPILESIDENTINLYKEKGTMEQNSLYQALKPHQRALSVDISTRFIGELAIAAYNTNRQVESLSGDHFGHYHDAQTLDSLSQSIERMLEYPLIELGTKDFNYGFMTISNVFYHYLAEQEGDLVLSRSDLDLLLARIEEQPLQVVDDIREEGLAASKTQEKALEMNPEPGQVLAPEVIKMDSARYSIYQDYSVFLKEGVVYLGKHDNYQGSQGYDNRDQSLIRVSDNKKMWSLLSEDGWVYPVQTMVKMGTFTESDIQEFEDLKSGLLKDLTLTPITNYSVHIQNSGSHPDLTREKIGGTYLILNPDNDEWGLVPYQDFMTKLYEVNQSLLASGTEEEFSIEFSILGNYPHENINLNNIHYEIGRENQSLGERLNWKLEQPTLYQLDQEVFNGVKEQVQAHQEKVGELIRDIASIDGNGFYLEHYSELYDKGASSGEIEVFRGLIPTIENKGDSFTLTIENVSEPGFSDFLALNGDPIGETKIYDHLDKLSLQPEQQLRFLEDLKTAVSSTWNEAVTTYDKTFDEVVAMYSLEKTSKDYFVRFEFSEHDFNYQSGEIIPYEAFAKDLYNKYHFSPQGYYKTYFEVLDANKEAVSGPMRIDIGSDWDSIGFYLSEDNPHKSALLEKDALVMKSLEEEVKVAEKKENALEQVPEQEKKTEGTIEDLSGQIQKAAPLPEANESQPLNGLSPSQTGPQSLLHFTISGEGKSITKRYYHKISEHDLMKLNRYAHNIQQIANWYLDTVADSEIIYFYQEGDVVNSVQIRFDKDKFQHLTGVFPYKEGQTAEQTVIDFAQGQGDFDSIFLANKGTAFDKLKVLPDLPAIVDASSFYFGDLSDVPKLHALDMSKAIKSKDEDIVLALRTADESTFPASLMKLREGLKIQLEESKQERIILGIYRERDGQVDQLSINEEYVKDGGQEMLSILKNKQYEETTDIETIQEVKEGVDRSIEEMLDSNAANSLVSSIPQIQENLSAERNLLAMVQDNGRVSYTNQEDFGQEHQVELVVHSGIELDQLSEAKAPWTLALIKGEEKLGYLAYGSDWGNDFQIENELKNIAGQIDSEKILEGLYKQEEVEAFLASNIENKDGQEMQSILQNKQYEESTDIDKNQEQPLSISAEEFTPVLDTAYNVGEPRKIGSQPTEEFQAAWERYYELSDAHEGDFKAVVEAADQLGLVNKESDFYREWSQDRIHEENYHVQIRWFERWPDGPQLPFNEIDRVDYQRFVEVLYEQNKAFYGPHKASIDLVQETGSQGLYIPYTKVKFDLYAPGGKLIEENMRYDIASETEPISARLFSIDHHPLEGQAELAVIDEKVLSQLNPQAVGQDAAVEVPEQSLNFKEKKSALAQRVEEIIAADTDAKVEAEVIQETGDEAFDYSKASAHEISEHAFQKIREYTQSPEDLFEYLDFMSQFPKLSPRNVALIQEQWPGANAVATYNQWQEKGKVLGVGPEDVMTTKAKYTNKKTGEAKEKLHQNLSVRAGEKSKITLFRPLMVKMIPVLDEQGRQLKNDKGNLQYKKLSQATPQEKSLVKEGKLPVRQFQERDLETGYPRYITYKVFELSQTNLKPEAYPKAMPNRHYNFDVDQVKTKEILAGLQEYAAGIGITIMMDKNHDLGNAKGGFSPDEQLILMNPHNTPGEKIGTLIHELAHATLHNPKFAEQYKGTMTLGQKEFEAEMTSYLLSKHFGLDTSEKSIQYMASWTKNLSALEDKDLAASLQRVHKTVSSMMKKIDGHVKAPQIEQERGEKVNFFKEALKAAEKGIGR